MAVTILLTTTIDNAEAYTVDPALIANVKSYAAETHHGTDHIERWNRVLHAFGVIQHTSTMTAQEAQTYADKGWNRWIPVVTALTELEKAAATQQQDTTAPVITLQGVSQVTLTVGDTYTDAGAVCTDDTDGAISVSDDSASVDTQTPNSYTITYSCTDSSGNVATPVYRTVTVEEPPTQTNLVEIDQTVIDAVTDWRNEQAVGTPHYERWDRVLAAFGVTNRNDPMTSTEAQGYADKGWNRWVSIVDILTDLETAANQQQQQDQQQQDTQQSEQVNPSTCNWQDPNYVNPPSCFEQQQIPQDQQLTVIQQYEQLRTQALALHNEIVSVHTEGTTRQAENPTKYSALNTTWNLYKSTNNLENVIKFGDRVRDGTITFIPLVDYVNIDIPPKIRGAQIILGQMKGILAEFSSSYGPLNSCPSQNDLTTNKERVNYIKAELVREKTIIGGSDDIPDGGTYKSGTKTYVTYTYTDGTLKHSLTERICAYHDITYNSEWHTNLVKQAMLALGIHPKADNITPMTADEARQMARMYDNSQYTWQNPDDGFPAWKEKLWDDIATKIRNVEHDKHYAENYNEINDQRTEQEECDLPNVICEYHSEDDGGYVSKQTVYKINDADLRKVTSYDGNIKNIKSYDSQDRLVLHNIYNHDDPNNPYWRTSKGYYTHSGQVAWDIGYNPDGSLRTYQTWHHDTIGSHDRNLVSFTKIANGEVVRGSVYYSDINQAQITKSTNGSVKCYNTNGDTITCTAEHEALLDLDRYPNPSFSLYAEQSYDKHGNIMEIKLYDKGVLEAHTTYHPYKDSGKDPTPYLKVSKVYNTNGELRQNIEYNAEGKITYYREYYPSGNLFASSNNFDSDNTVINGRIYHDNSDSTANQWIHQSSHGNFSCKLPIPSAIAVDCTPDEISLFKRTFAKFR